MNIKLMCLGTDLSMETVAAQDKIVEKFNQVLKTETAFENYGSEKTFIKGLGEAVTTEDIIVLATQADLFLPFKKFVASAFQFKQRPVKTVQKLIKEIYPELDAELINSHAMLPTDATAILTNDGLYTAYAVKAEDQIMAVLPLDSARIDYILEDGLFPYLHDTVDFGEEPEADPLEGISEETDAIGAVPVAPAVPVAEEVAVVPEVPAAPETPAAPEETPAAETPVEAPVQEDLPFDAAFINRVVNELREKDLTVAIATTKTVDFLKTVSESVNMDGCIFLSPYTVEKADMAADEYAVALAKGAFDTADTSVGAALTKVFSKTLEDGSKEYYIYACVADGDSANEAKVTAQPGDTPPQLIYKAVEVLFRMLQLWEKTGVAEPQYGDEAAVDDDFEPAELNEEAKEMSDHRRAHRFLSSGLIIIGTAASVAVSLLAANFYGAIG